MVRRPIARQHPASASRCTHDEQHAAEQRYLEEQRNRRARLEQTRRALIESRDVPDARRAQQLQQELIAQQQLQQHRDKRESAARTNRLDDAAMQEHAASLDRADAARESSRRSLAAQTGQANARAIEERRIAKLNQKRREIEEEVRMLAAPSWMQTSASSYGSRAGGGQQRVGAPAGQPPWSPMGPPSPLEGRRGL